MSLIRLSKKGWDILSNRGFSSREYEVLSAFLNSRDQDQTAKKLYITKKTVKHHMVSIYKRFGFSGVTQLWQYLVKERMIELIVIENELPPVLFTLIPTGPMVLPTSALGPQQLSKGLEQVALSKSVKPST